MILLRCKRKCSPLGNYSYNYSDIYVPVFIFNWNANHSEHILTRNPFLFSLLPINVLIPGEEDNNMQYAYKNILASTLKTYVVWRTLSLLHYVRSVHFNDITQKLYNIKYYITLHRNIRLLSSFARTVSEYKYYVFGNIGKYHVMYYMYIYYYNARSVDIRTESLRVFNMYTCIIYLLCAVHLFLGV